VRRVADGLAAGAGDTAAAAFMQADQRHPVMAGQFLGIDAFAQPGFVWRAAAKGEVFATDHTAPAIEGAESEHEIGRGKGFQRPVGAAFRIARPSPHLMETAGVEQHVDPLPDCLPAGIMLAADAFRPALIFGQGLLMCNIADFAFPTHA
jgi:hypothetical protein